ncbi:MAG: hypothetical protein HKP34_02250 [Nitrosopumilus sp.]|nr:hypothetical protein [Nitrosopumilus sp.]NNL37110.1 hypothetical protein [Nitrosopumilus sp.]
MNDEEKGKRFLKLIDDQNNIQWGIVAKLTALISSDWNSQELKNEIKSLVEDHTEITKELNSLDDKGSIL